LPRILAYVQARMSSQRFPGKVLAPLAGKPVLAHLLERLRTVRSLAGTIVVTSTCASDEPIWCYAERQGVPVFRGPLENVLQRFRLALAEHPCDWIVRVCGDSPLLDPVVVESACLQAMEDRTADLISTRLLAGHPKGQNVEVIRAGALSQAVRFASSPEDHEHVTPVFYRYADRFLVRPAVLRCPPVPNVDCTVDTPQDLQRLVHLLEGLSCKDVGFTASAGLKGEQLC
jgi:spore coat polysaccharide biosynthesis protein SpsF